MAFADTGRVGVDFAETRAGTGTSSNQGNDFALGTIQTAKTGQRYMYVHASAAIAQYDWVGIDEDFEAAPITKAMADDGWYVGVCQVALADDDFGWAAIKGTVQGKLLISCAADVALYTSATAGSLDDSSTSQTKIDGVVSTTTITAATNTEIIMTFPKSNTF